MNHTPEPWKADEYGVLRDSEDKPIILPPDNSNRVVACVNACAGMPNADIEELVNSCGANPVMKLTVYADDMRLQRDELLAALKEVTPAFNMCRIIMDSQDARDDAGAMVERYRSLIAKVEGKP